MAVRELSRADARRIAVRAQLLDSSRPAGLLDVVRRLTLLQVDPTAVLAPNADLVAWSRLGSSYTPAQLDAALEDRALVELRAMIRPAEDLALYRADMARWERAERTYSLAPNCLSPVHLTSTHSTVRFFLNLTGRSDPQLSGARNAP